ncbi:MAG: BamA/TamA family outer membrane protein, partial [Bacteroidota bacterium]|nr:BamA/TamA family outer membrane protein [Bacteroidota bacterium]
PQDGCPGPVEILLGDSIVLVLMDSQWWLHLHDKPGPQSQCDYRTPDQIVTALEEIVATHPDQLLILAMHHPLYSNGVHGGNYLLKDHIFPLTAAIPWLYLPLPGLGSIYPITRGVFGNIQDIKHPLYRSMVSAIEGALKKHSNTIAVGGHDHGLQMIMREDSIAYIVSGAGAEISRVKSGKYTLFDSATYGFAMVEVRKSGQVETKFYTLGSKNLEDPSFTKQLKTIVMSEKKASENIRIVSLPDSVVVAANPNLKGNGFKKLFFGKNYRAEWTEPVKVKVLDILTEKGGLKPTVRGGGKQTKSLRFDDSTGKEYSLRSIQKFPAPAIPPELRGTFAKDIVEDGISASYPYGSLSTIYLEAAAHVPVLEKQLLYVADDTLLGRFRDEFANTLCILEEKEPGHIKKTFNTDEVIVKLMKDNDDHINQKTVLHARLLDMFIMDFDRHEGQWRWYTTDTGKGKLYNPIPKDRDQAFFTNQGIIPALARQRALVPDIQGLRPKAYDIKTFNNSARNFDRTFLNGLNEEDWKKGIDEFLSLMTNDVIEKSLQLQPKEIQKYSAKKIVNILKERRKYLESDALKYYRFISKIVNVVGSTQNELFTITRSHNSVHVVVNKLNKEGEVKSKMYDRVFDPHVTKEIRLYGMAGDDKFIFSGERNRIKIRIIGGPGKDEFESEGNSNRTLVYDASFEENKFTGNNNFRKKISSDPTVNQYNRLYYKYNVLSYLLSGAYNRDDGLFLGLKFNYTTHGFRKEPYKTNHQIIISRALATNAFNIKYNADFISAIGHSDLLIRSDIKAPINIKNFFGLGNESVFDEAKYKSNRYYRARYNLADVSLLLRKNLQSWMNVTFGPAFQYYNLDSNQNKNRFINNFSENGLDPALTSKNKTYLGLALNLDIDSRNNKVLPTRGSTLNMSVKPMLGLNKAAQNYAQLNFDIAIFASITQETRIVFATRLGIAHNIGHYEFFQANYLGGNENLRGFHNYRFAGGTRIFNNTEIRFRIADFKTYLFPGAVGLVVFNDIGKVSLTDQHTTKWHDGYGAGLWITPLKRFVITGYYTRSVEGVLPLVTFGFQF